MTPDDVLGKIINHEILLKKPNMSRTYPRELSLQRNKTLLSKLSKRARARRL
jgi:hypothetical protein